MKKRYMMSFGFVTTAGGRNGHLVAELSVQAGKETILVYKENPNRAFAQRSALSISEMVKFCEKHTLLEVPRLSSKEYYKRMCHTSSGCSLLVVPGNPGDYFSLHMQVWRKTFVGGNGLTPAKGYIDASKQGNFLKRLGLLPLSHETCADGVSSSWKVVRIRHVKSRVMFAVSAFCPESGASEMDGVPSVKWMDIDNHSELLEDEHGLGLPRRMLRVVWRYLHQVKTTLQLYPQVFGLVIAMVMTLLWLCLLPAGSIQDATDAEQDFLNFEDSDSEWQYSSNRSSSATQHKDSSSTGVRKSQENRGMQRSRQLAKDDESTSSDSEEG
jgi:hypothetical protein